VSARAGLLLDRLGLLPAVLALAWILGGLPLLLAGVYRPLPAVAAFAVLAVPMAGWAWRVASPHPAAWWSVAAVVGIAVAFVLVNGLLHSEHVVLRRDAGSYAQIADWLAAHGRVPIPARLDAFGGRDPALVTYSPAFYDIGDAVEPQFMTGLPLLLAAGGWLAGWAGMFWLPPVFGGAALLAFGALTARLVGPRWAPLAVLVLAVTQPVWHAARSTYSEPLALLFILTALLALTVALDRGRPGAAGLAGLLLAGSMTVRVDALREVMLAVPVAGALVLARRRAAWPLVGGLAAGLALGLADALLFARGYLRGIATSLLPLVALFVVTLTGTVAAVAALRRRRFNFTGLHHPATAVSLAVVATFAFFVVRPLVHTGYTRPLPSVAGLQLRQGLPVDGRRTYAEFSLHWLSWWVGWPLLVLAVGAAAVLAARVVRGRASWSWAAVLVVTMGSTLLTLWRPGITPDHPWADRRFVVVVLPGLVLLATWSVSELSRRFGGARRTLVTGAGILAALGPAVWASAALFPLRTEVGQPAAIERVCAALPGDAAVLLVDWRARREWPSMLRGQCGVPVAGVTLAIVTQPGVTKAVVTQADGRQAEGRVPGVSRPEPEDVRRLVARIRAAGHTPILLAAEYPAVLSDLGLQPRQVVSLATTEDSRSLARRPSTTAGLAVDVWIAVPRPGEPGASAPRRRLASSDTDVTLEERP